MVDKIFNEIVVSCHDSISNRTFVSKLSSNSILRSQNEDSHLDAISLQTLGV